MDKETATQVMLTIQLKEKQLVVYIRDIAETNVR